MTRGFARFTLVVAALMIALGVFNFVVNGPGTWSSYVLVAIGTFCVAQAVRRLRAKQDGPVLFAFHWPTVVIFLASSLVLGLVLGFLRLDQQIGFLVAMAYLAVALFLFLGDAARRAARIRGADRAGPGA